MEKVSDPSVPMRGKSDHPKKCPNKPKPTNYPTTIWSHKQNQNECLQSKEPTNKIKQITKIQDNS